MKKRIRRIGGARSGGFARQEGSGGYGVAVRGYGACRVKRYVVPHYNR